MRRVTTTRQYSIALMLLLMAMLAMVVALATLGVFAAPASAQEEKSVLCHRTGSEENPFLVVEVDGSAIPGAHTGHGDFILGPASKFEGMTDNELEKACVEADPTSTGTTTGDGSAADDQYIDGGAADDQYDGGDVDNPKDVIPDTTSKKPLPNTGGVPLLGLAVGALALVGVGFSVLRNAIRREP